MNVRPIVRAMCRPMVRGVVPSAFSPLSLYANGEEGAWYDPSDLTTLYQDSTGTTPVTTDGDPVGLMLDKSGNDNHATQASSGLKPIYRTDGTLHWLEFDGFDDFIRCDSGVVTAQPTHQFHASRYLSGLNMFNGVSAASVQYLVVNAGTFRMDAGSTVVLSSGDTAPHVWSLLYDGAASYGRKDGDVQNSGDAGANGWQGVTLGASRIDSGNAALEFYGHIAVAGREASAPEIDSVENYLATKSGVTL